MGRLFTSTDYKPVIFNMTAAAAAPKAEKAAKPKTPAAHPPYAAMIKAAIKGLADKKGSSRQAILKYVCANYKVDAAKAPGRVRIALKKMIAAKALVAAAAAGKKGAGSFKLPVAAKEPKAKKPATKKPKAKKPAAKKAKKVAKPAAKKPKAAKKPTTKKAAPKKKPAAKKPAAKKAAPKKK